MFFSLHDWCVCVCVFLLLPKTLYTGEASTIQRDKQRHGTLDRKSVV